MKQSALIALCTFVVLRFSALAYGQEQSPPDVGSTLPPLQFEDLNKLMHRFDWKSPEPKTTVIVFFEPRCADCFRELVFLDSVSRLARGLNLEVFTVEGSGQEPLEVETTLSRFVSIFQEPAFTVVPDPGYTLSTLLGVQRVPSTFLVASNGLLISRTEGFDNLHAIGLARNMERLLDMEKGKLSPALVNLGINSNDEQNYETALRRGRITEASEESSFAPLAVGTPVATFSFVDLNGERGSFSPSGDNGKPMIVFFWGAMCQPCIREMAYLEQLHSVAGAVALDIVAVEATGLATERVSQVMERYRRLYPPPSFAVVADPDRRLSRRFGVGGLLPHTFLLGADGEVLYHSGEFVQGGERALAATIEKALGIEEGILAEKAGAAASSQYGPSDESAEVLRTLSNRSEEFTSTLLRAETLYRNWQYAAAIPFYLRCLELDPGNVAVRERLGEVYQRQGELELALEQWQKILEIEPGHSGAAGKLKELEKRVKP